MKAIINGFRYDTDKAILIGTSEEGNYPRDGNFRSWRASLYVTPKAGNYFLAGEGGAMTRFSRSAGQNSWCGGSGIHPMSKDEALAWAERELTPSDFEAHFADAIQDA